MYKGSWLGEITFKYYWSSFFIRYFSHFGYKEDDIVMLMDDHHANHRSLPTRQNMTQAMVSTNVFLRIQLISTI